MLSTFLHRTYAPEGDGRRISDKGTFSGWCAEHGFPAPQVLAVWDDGALVHEEIEGRGLPEDDLFSKPTNMNQGWQTARWRYDGAGGWVGRDGRTRTGAALLEELAAASRQIPSRRRWRSKRLALMPCLRNHSDVLPLTTGALCSMRVVTYRAPGGRAQLLNAAFKMATGDAPADNFHFGGVMSPVDLATGRLGTGLRRVGHLLLPTERHPDTDVEIAGYQLPDWDVAITTALRAHDASLVSPLFGWDVALTANGPMLLEGNIDSGVDIMQAPSGQPLGLTPYVAAVNAHMRALEARGMIARPIAARGSTSTHGSTSA